MILKIYVKPNSKKGPLIETQDDGLIIIYIREVAANDKANQAVIKLLSKHFKIAKTNIKINKGITNRHKIIEIIGI